MRMRFTAKPGMSFTSMKVFPSFSASFPTEPKVSSEVCRPRMPSTSFISGTGFMKCMPATLSGRFVAAAIFVIEIDEVFVASNACGGQIWSSSLNTLSFKSTFSAMASMTTSQSLKSVSALPPVMRPRISFFFASVRSSFLIRRSQLEAIVAKPLSRAACEMSTSRT